MKKDFCEVIIDLSKGSAYEYNMDSKMPTLIKYGRQIDGKFEKGIVEGVFNNSTIHNIVYGIKRGWSKDNILSLL